MADFPGVKAHPADAEPTEVLRYAWDGRQLLARFIVDAPFPRSRRRMRRSDS